MPDPPERFIDAVVSPLDDNAEMQVAARHHLAEAIADASPDSGDSLENAAATLEQRDRSRFLSRWKVGWYALTGIVSALVLGLLAASVVTMWPAYRMLAGALYFAPLMANPKMDDDKLAGHLTPEQRLLLLGDTTRSDKVERFKGLWESDPTNPAYYADYAVIHIAERRTLPPDFLETARKLDPDNGWFIAMAAADAANLAIDSRSRPTSATPGGVKLRVIKDPAKRDEALALLNEASTKPRYESYQATMLEKRIPLLPPRTDTVDQCVPMAHLVELSFSNFQTRALGDLVAIQAADLAKAGDREGFEKSLRAWRSFTEGVARSRNSYVVEGLLATVMFRAPVKAQQQAAIDLGLPDEAARLKALDDRFEARKNQLSHSDPPMPWIRDRANIFGAMAFPVLARQTLRPPEIDPAALKPGRLADHAFAGRVLALGAWAVLGLAMIVMGLYRFRGSALTRRLSARLAELLTPSDHAWIIGMGIVLPALYYLGIYRLTPLGCRDWGLAASAFAVPFGQFVTMLSLMLVLPVLLVRARLNQRAGAAGLRAKPSRWPWSWIAVTLAAAALPTFGIALVKGGNPETMLIIAAALLGTLHLYWIVGALRALFSKQASLLRRMILSRAVIPAYAAAMILMMLAMPLYHIEERHWFARDEFSRLSVAKPSYTPYEYEVTQALQEELRDIIAEQP